FPRDDAMHENAFGVVLTSYSVRALAWLSAKGYETPEYVVSAAREYLAERISGESDDAGRRSGSPGLMATALSVDAIGQADESLVASLWQSWPSGELATQIVLARIMAAHDHPDAPEAVQRILAAAPLKAGARRLVTGWRY